MGQMKAGIGSFFGKVKEGAVYAKSQVADPDQTEKLKKTLTEGVESGKEGIKETAYITAAAASSGA